MSWKIDHTHADDFQTSAISSEGEQLTWLLAHEKLAHHLGLCRLAPVQAKVLQVNHCAGFMQ